MNSKAIRPRPYLKLVLAALLGLMSAGITFTCVILVIGGQRLLWGKAAQALGPSALLFTVLACRSPSTQPIDRTKGDRIMTSKTEYTEQEWAGLVRAPVTAGSYIIIADPSVMAMVSETQAMMQTIQAQQAPEAAKELVAAVVAEIVAMASRKEKMAQPQVEKSQDPRPQILASLKQDLAVLDVKSTPDEKAGFCAWLLTVANAAAEAGREGGFLGIGAVRVSDQEKAALEDLKRAFGLS